MKLFYLLTIFILSSVAIASPVKVVLPSDIILNISESEMEKKIQNLFKNHSNRETEIKISHNKSKKNIQKFIDDTYQGVSGFDIPAAEKELIKKESSEKASTYGEIKSESIDALLKDLKPREDDVFCDIGSGNGRVVVECFLKSKMRKCYGIELSRTRFNNAMTAKQKTLKFVPKRGNRILEFYNKNIIDPTCDISDATIVYMCSTCFSVDLMEKITNKLANEVKNLDRLRIISLTELPKNKYFKEVKRYNLPMTWTSGSGTTVYLYRKA